MVTKQVCRFRCGRLLPDTRAVHKDKLIKGENFSDAPGKLAIVNYKVEFASAGKCFVWARVYSTGSEDNGVYVGLNGKWPDSRKKMQWCSDKNKWAWESKQRTNANHCGEARKIFLNVPSPGVHTVSFSMREDGFEMDKFILSKDYVKPKGEGQKERLKNCNSGKALESKNVNASQSKSLKLYPNPANTFMIVEGSTLEQILIYNALGEVVKSIKIPKRITKFEMDVSSLSSGLYFLKARGITANMQGVKFIKK